MKRYASLCFALLSSAAYSQIPNPLPALSDVFRSLQTSLIAPTPLYISPQPSNPFDISPFPPEVSRNPGTATNPPGDPHQVQILHSGPNSTAVGNTLTLRDDVQILFRGYRMRADNVEWNRTTGVFILRGTAQLTGDGAVVKANRIIVDTRARTYEAYGSNSDLKPNLVGGLLLSDVYVKGQYSTGNERRSIVNGARLTTCRYETPHYEIDAHSVDARFERRIILRNVTIVLLQKPIIHLPFLVLPLDNRSYQNLPSVGEDPIEGYYIKTHYGIPLSGDQTLYSRLDYMTRLGLGIGGDYFYNHPAKQNPFQGQLSVYGVPQVNSFQIQQSQTGSVGKLAYQIQNSLVHDDYIIAPTSVIQNSRLTFALPNKWGTNGLTFARNDNSSGGFDSLQQSIGYTSTENWSKAFSTALQLNYNDTGTTFSGDQTGTNNTRQTVDINFRAQDDLQKATAILEYQRSVPIGSLQNFINPTDRTPNVSLQSDSRKLFGSNFGTELPFKTSLSIGDFSDPITGAGITRDSFALSFDKATDPQARAHFDINGLFNQQFYSDSTAQYVMGIGGSMGYRLGSDTSFNIRYNYLHPEGYTPLGIDQSGKQNLLTEDLSFRPSRSLLLGVQTGYDALQPEQGLTAWQPVGIRTEYTPTKEYLFRTLTTYDPFIKGFANFRYDFSYKHGATYVGLGGWYDNTRHIWTETNMFINALTMGRTKIDLRASFNGYTKQFDQRQIAFSYDLHDAFLVFQVINNAVGYNNGTQFSLFIQLKAFPFSTNFGAGNRGQAIGTGTGVGY